MLVLVPVCVGKRGVLGTARGGGGVQGWSDDYQKVRGGGLVVPVCVCVFGGGGRLAQRGVGVGGVQGGVGTCTATQSESLRPSSHCGMGRTLNHVDQWRWAQLAARPPHIFCMSLAS